MADQPTDFPPPNIARWIRHQTVSTTALLKELEDWATWLRGTEPPAPRPLIEVLADYEVELDPADDLVPKPR